MGRLIYSMAMSLDGFAAAPDGSLDRVHVDNELHAHFTRSSREMSAAGVTLVRDDTSP